ncbi:MAG: metallophosphoesterase, partial [Treponema sp.]|nr:metallophosphoesterase [Treponema sp.]
VVNNFSYQQSEWNNADSAISLLDDIVPFIIIPGNHDYDEIVISKEFPKATVQGNTFFNSFFGPESIHFKNKEWYGGAYNDGMNSWAVLNCESEKILILGLELEPTEDVLNWAQSVIDQNNLPTILCIHEFLSMNYSKTNPGNADFAYGGYRYKYNGKSPEYILEKLIKKNNQVFLVLCGHYAINDDSENIRTDINDFGNKVYLILSDYQFRNSLLSKDDKKKYKWYGGDGWLRLISFFKDRKSIHIQTYSTEFKCYEKDYNSDFIIKFDWNWKERFYKSMIQ